MYLKNNIKKFIGFALALGICASNCFGSSYLFAEENDDGVITLPFISLTDIDDISDSENGDKKIDDDKTGSADPENDETEMIKDDGTIILPFVPFEDENDDDELISGDINEDGVVSAADIMILKMVILKALDTDFNTDLNNDSKTDVMDLMKLMNIVLG